MRAWWLTEPHRPLNRWNHYFDIYARHLSRYVDTPVRLLEIGVSGGGGLQMWRKFLGPQSKVVGLDIEDARFEEEGVTVEIGDQANPHVLARIVRDHGPFDIVVDDGSHKPLDIYASFANLYFNGMNERGVYLVEDMHCGFRPAFGGGPDGGMWLRQVQKWVGHMMAIYGDAPDPLPPKHPHELHDLVEQTNSIHIYPLCVVFERERRTVPLQWDFR